jgi:hypothetical protein
MKTSKSWLVAVIFISLAYLLFPRYEMKVISYSYPATALSGLSRPAHGTAVVFRLDRWTGKIDYSYSTSKTHTWTTIRPSTGE